MGDLVVLLLVVGVFGALVGYVTVCDRILGSRGTGTPDARAEAQEADRVVR